MQILDVKTLEREIAERISALPLQDTESVRAARREYSKKIAGYPPQTVVELGFRLVERSQFLLRFVAYELIMHHKPALQSLDAKKLKRLGKGIDNWVTVDTFASYLAGPAWRERQVEDKVIHDWAQSSDRWWRRAALVSTVPLNNKARGGRGDASRTLQVCKILLNDRDDMIVKAMSWALRELSKRDHAAVLAFVNESERELAPRVIREVKNKLQTGLKNPKPNKAQIFE